MAASNRAILARLGYGILFCVLLPALLVFWASRLEVGLPVLHWPGVGAAVAAVGAVVVAWGMLMLLFRGRGLPMNVFPPPKLVTTGIYAILPHPIYVGAVLLSAGISLWCGSAAGLWVVTPVVALAAAALVWGYERDDLLRRFAVLPRPWLSLPPAGAERPTPSQSLAVGLLVPVPWLILYEAVPRLGQPPGALDFRLHFERAWPVWGWSEIPYGSAYLIVPLVLFLAPTRSSLRRFAIQGLLAIGGITLVYLLLPAISPTRPHHVTGWLGYLLDLERQYSDPPVAAFPSFHIVWACLAAEVLERRGRLWGTLGWLWAMAVAFIPLALKS
jgi:protein-S-isoprenylcysteine O-methyltransferase Ste14